MTLQIFDEILKTANITPEELQQEIALMLFQREKLTLGQASRLSGLGRLAFQRLLASRQIPVHYDIKEYEEDLNTLRELGRI
jgi:predicted HTH domain antitoxin